MGRHPAAFRSAAFAVLFCAAGIASSLSAETLEDARAAWSSGDYRVAVSVLEDLARGGNPEARSLLARAYDLGSGVEQDFQRALSLYTTAAGQGLADASYRLATLLAEGRPGIPADTAQAIVHLDEAIAQDHPEALNARGEMLAQGIGGEVDAPGAVALFRLAHDMGDVDGTANLADMLRRGEGVEADTTAALVLWQNASARGHGPSTGNLGWMYDTGTAVAQDRSAAFALFTLAAQQGDVTSGRRLFDVLIDPGSPRHDPERALAWCLWTQQRLSGDGELAAECADAAAILNPQASASARTLALRLTQ